MLPHERKNGASRRQPAFAFVALCQPQGEPPADGQRRASMSEFDEILADLEKAVEALESEPEWETLAHSFIIDMLGASAGLNAFPLAFRLAFVVMFSFLVRSVNESHLMGIEEATKHIKTAFLALYFAHHIMQKEILPRGAQ